MSQASLPERIVDQLRANLRAAGIDAAESDIQGIVEKGFLSRLPTIEQILEGAAADSTPDYLGGWSDRSAPAAFPTSGEGEQTAAIEQALPLSPAWERGSGGEGQLHYATLAHIAELIRTRQISPVELLERTLERIARRDPAINAYQLVLADRARAAAAQAEREIASGGYRGPLHGVPIAVKDLLDMAGTPTTAGSKILADRIADADSTAVVRLEQAGAVIVGKTRLSEFAYSPGSNNAHYGSTRNPWSADHDTGGSSSGSTAAVAAGLAYAALGSDTGGSIRIPASLCGVVGLKPTFGWISLAGAVPLAWSLDHLGPLTRGVGDAALLLAALAGPDPRDRRTAGAPPFSAAGLAGDVRGLRVGVLGDDGSGAPLGSDEALAAWRAGLAALESAGAELVPVDLPELEALRWLNGAVLAIEASAFHLPWLRARLADYGEFPRQRLLAAFVYTSGAFVRAQQARAALRRRCDALFERVDLLCTPSQPGAATPLGSPAYTTFTGPFNLLGWPAISVPVGLTAIGLPLGLQLAGRPWDDATVLRAAWAVEAGIGHAYSPPGD
ncbi:MAG TPA: amidase [Roseiflexaceae bacterium]|nr:amidase [Roseiflexaceae bacterium]